MMLSVNSKNICVDVEATRELYSHLTDHSKENASAYNFARNIAVNECVVMEYFDAIGINPYRYQELHVEGTNAARQTLMYWGVFPLKVYNKDDVLLEIRNQEKHYSDVEMIETEFGFTFFLGEWNKELGLYFDIELPWILAPHIEKGRYENIVLIPEINIAEIEQ